MFKNILIATDGSPLAEKALDKGMQLAKALGAKVTVVTVTEALSPVMLGETTFAIDLTDFAIAMEAHASDILTRAKATAARQDVMIEILHMPNQDASDGIIAAAKDKGCDLIVMASHGRRGLQRMLLGSQTNRVVTVGETPVLVVR